MAKHLLKFNTAAEYNAATINKPAVSWVVEDNEVKYDPYVPPYVEIGGVKWAKMNIGAETETDYGLYFQWGDISGYTASQVGSGDGKKAFTWADYKYSNNGGSSASDMTKYNKTDGKTVLESVDDAAIANCGSDWRMPTEAEFNALLSATNNEWVTNYGGSGKSGRLFTAKNNSSKVLFFPAAGHCDNGTIGNVGNYSYYWSSTRNPNYSDYAMMSRFESGMSRVGTFPRLDGEPIRPVHV